MDDFDMFASNPTPAPAQMPTDLTSQQDDMFGFGDTSSSNNATTATLPSTVDDQQSDSSWAIEDVGEKKESDVMPEFGGSNLDFGGITSTPQQFDVIGGRSFDELSAPAPSSSNDFDNQTFQNQNEPYNADVTDTYTSSSEPSPAANNSLFNDYQQEQSDASFDLYAAPPAESGTSSSTSMFDSNVSPVQAFNIRRQEEIAAKDAQERAKIDEMKQQARNDLKRWYDERKLQLDTQNQTIRKEEEILRSNAQEKSNKETCDWAKVIRFLEFSGTTLTKSKRDLGRMKTCILNAKRSGDSTQRSNGV